MFADSPTKIPRIFNVETTWKRPFPRRFNVEYTLCVCRENFFYILWYCGCSTFFFKYRIFKTIELFCSLKALFFIKNCNYIFIAWHLFSQIVQVRSVKWDQKLLSVNNDYTKVTKVYEDYVKFRKGRKHKRQRKTKKLVFQKNR